MTRAFEPGDPVLELAALGQGVPITVLDKDDQPWLRKAEQQKIDEVRAFGGHSSLIRTTSFGHRPCAWDTFNKCLEFLRLVQ